MNVFRAKEISESPEMKHVTYLDQQIYIQHVDEQNEMARIFPLNEPEHEFDVDVSLLTEHQ